MRSVFLTFFHFLLFFTIVNFSHASSIRDLIIDSTLDGIEQRHRIEKTPANFQEMASSESYKEINSKEKIKDNFSDVNFKDPYSDSDHKEYSSDLENKEEWKSSFKEILTLKEEDKVHLGLNIGYLQGNTAYDYANHTSELEYPMEDWMIGFNLEAEIERWNSSFNFNFWTDLEKDAGDDMKDKDWTSSGILYSYTKSDAELDAIILDVSGRYDFFKQENKNNRIRLGFTLGYKYQQLNYVMEDLYYILGGGADQGQTLYSGENVLRYKVEYYLPYIGLAANYDTKKWGLGLNSWWSFYPTAEDRDNHVLRDLTFYGDYDKNGEAWMVGVNGYYEFKKDWRIKLGAEGSIVRIDGRTWDSTHNPAWDQNQSIDARQFLGWCGIDYIF